MIAAVRYLSASENPSQPRKVSLPNERESLPEAVIEVHAWTHGKDATSYVNGRWAVGRWWIGSDQRNNGYFSELMVMGSTDMPDMQSFYKAVECHPWGPKRASRFQISHLSSLYCTILYLRHREKAAQLRFQSVSSWNK